MLERFLLVLTWAVLALWVVGPIVAIAMPPRQHDPQRGMAVGLLIMVSIIGAVVSLVYAAGLVWELWLFKRGPNCLACFVVAILMVNAAAWVVRAARGE